MKVKLKRKLKSSRGETLIETLVSIIIIAIVMAFLCTASITAGKVNKAVKDADNSFTVTESTKNAKVSFGDQTFEVPFYETDNGYLYYGS